MIGLLRRILNALRGGAPQQLGSEPEPERVSPERLDAAHEQLKETIPPREDGEPI